MKKYILYIILFASQNFLLDAQDTIYLANDSLLSTTGPKVYFKGSTKIVLNPVNEVIEGILLKDSYLWTGRRLIFCKAGFLVKFNMNGNVIAAFLSERTALWTGRQNLVFRDNSYTEFNNDGAVLKGELFHDQELEVRGKPIVFRRAEPVEFDDSGNVLKGIIDKREHLLNSQGKVKAYRAGSMLMFNDKTEVVVGEEDRSDEANKN
jgi:hypothetical protein